ncbi:transmembrane protein 272 [Aplysia californica]|uniref:Transmembrane protein 272 n=1 Tax=Aplysia californica TaxID=6500 RepID=A0ABM0JN85_APLCA|nr:transmembrane protein 272 [Aplysia californica]
MPSSQSEEPTEMTAMTDPEVTSSDGVAVTGTTARDHRKAFFKRYFRSPVGKYVLAIFIIGTLAIFAYLFSKIVMGAMYLNSCPVDRFVPIYLVVSSSLLIICIVILLIVFFKCRREESDESVSSHHLIALVYFFLHLVLQLAGSVCVIRTRNDLLEMTEVEKLDPSSACDKTLIEFAFGIVIFELVLSGLVLIAVLLILAEIIYLVCCSPSPEKQPTNR